MEYEECVGYERCIGYERYIEYEGKADCKEHFKCVRCAVMYHGNLGCGEGDSSDGQIFGAEGGGEVCAGDVHAFFYLH